MHLHLNRREIIFHKVVFHELVTASIHKRQKKLELINCKQLIGLTYLLHEFNDFIRPLFLYDIVIIFFLLFENNAQLGHNFLLAAIMFVLFFT